MLLVADLHVHSRFSRATSRGLDFAALHRSAAEKGIGLVGTGDFTHPGWLAEIAEQLEPAEEGLFRLRPELRRAVERDLPPACRGEVRFVLEVEISNIYKRGERVRKNHNLVYVPHLEAARKLNQSLAAIGNLASDGRPILGLDARDLLEITLATDPLSFLIPAHVWTPWFSMLGSKSGFDSLEECFRDLSEHVFAAETGLSSDPPMNWRLSRLDRLTLVSSSDAHSAARLGREANLLDIEPGFEPLRRAIEGGDAASGFLGTLEFHPQEGKYHLDGHRKCGVRLDPEQTRELGGRCPVCGGLLTVGVMHRVSDLADRPEGSRPGSAAPFESLVPLAEVISEAVGVGPQSKRVRGRVESLLAALGPEMHVLRAAPLEDVARVGGPVAAEAIRRVRAGELSVEAGYDGRFGAVRIFDAGERESLDGQLAFLAPSEKPKRRPRAEPKPGGAVRRPAPSSAREESGPPPALTFSDDPLSGLDDDQLLAAGTVEGPLLVVAGPGSGKTRTLVARIARQVRAGEVEAARVLAVAFTNQAAEQLEERLRDALPAGAGSPLVATFHGLAARLLEELDGTRPEISGDEQRAEIARAACEEDGERGAAAFLDRVSLAKQGPAPRAALAGDSRLLERFDRYQRLLAEKGLVDIDDLLLRLHERLAGEPGAAARIAERYRSVAIDEYQDVNDVQAALVGLLCPGGRGLCAIGDPHQAIYGFRGARPGHFARFAEAFPGARKVELGRSYRLTRPVLAAARGVLGDAGRLEALRDGPPVEVVGCPSESSEAEQILVRIERLIGGSSHFAVESGRAGDGDDTGEIGFGEIAVLTRTRAQRVAVLKALGRSGVPCRAVGEEEPHDPRSQKVAVMTMHAAKGREFEAVFAAGVEPGLLPLEAAGRRSDPDEERRLLYVAMTRARRLVVISHAERRALWGERLPGGPSRFLDGLPPGAVRRGEARIPTRPRSARQLDLF